MKKRVHKTRLLKGYHAVLASSSALFALAIVSLWAAHFLESRERQLRDCRATSPGGSPRKYDTFNETTGIALNLEQGGL
jgi:hypothetical protein